MILFQEDWSIYPTAVPHWETTNKSFLELAKTYHDMGVSNCLFHLSLLQKELAEVDPFDDKLTFDVYATIAVETKYNPWYYFREIVRLPAGQVPRRFEGNRGNVSLIWCFFNHFDYMLIQPRQTGKSGSADTLMINLMYFSMVGGRIALITKDDSLRKANIDRLKGIRDLLPAYLWKKDRLDADNQTELTYNLMGNTYSTAVAQKTESGAANIARGNANQVTQNDECPFCANIDITLPAALAAGTAAREFAERNGQPYGNLFTTTAGKKDTREGAYIYQLYSNAAVFTEMWYDLKDQATAKKVILSQCTAEDKKIKRLLVNGTWSHLQLGKTNAWLYEAIANAGGTPEEIDRDFFNRWTSGSLRSPLTTEQNNTIHSSEREPNWIDVSPEGYTMNWYIPKSEHERYMASAYLIMGNDPSDAVGRDNIGLVLCDVRDMSVAAAATVNEANLMQFGEYIATLLTKYPNVTWIPEKKSSGQGLIDTVVARLHANGIDPFKRIFNRLVEDMRVDKEASQVLNSGLGQRGIYYYNAFKNRFGFNTDARLRHSLYSEILPNAATRAAHLVRDRKLGTEIRGLVTKNDRIDHQASGHDDMVISWLLCFWMVMKATNLNHYGIPASSILSRSRKIGSSTEEYQAELELELQQQYRNEMEDLINTLKNTTNLYIVSKLETRLNVLNSKIKSMGGEAFSMESMMEDIREARRRGQRRKSYADMGAGNTASHQNVVAW